MRMNFFIVFAVCAMLLIAGCATKPKEVAKNETTAPASAPPSSGEAKSAEGKGKLVVAVTDDEPPVGTEVHIQVDFFAVNPDTGEKIPIKEGVIINSEVHQGIDALAGSVDLPYGTWEIKSVITNIEYVSKEGITTQAQLPSTTEFTVATATIGPETTIVTSDFHADTFYDPDAKPDNLVVTSEVEKAENFDTEVAIEDGKAIDIVLSEGTLESKFEATLPATGTPTTETQPLPTETGVEIVVNDNGLTVTTVTEVTATGIEVSTSTSTDIQTALQAAATDTGLTAAEVAKVTEFTHEEAEQLAKQASEFDQQAIELLAQAADVASESAAKGNLQEAITFIDSAVEQNVPTAPPEEQAKIADFKAT